MIKIEFTTSEEFVVFISVIKGEDTDKLKDLTKTLNASSDRLKQAEDKLESGE